MTQSYDAIVVGLGAMGSAATYELARRGRRVLGIDRFTPPHQMGSSHGYTRIIREAYFEHPLYVPLVRRAFELWTSLDREVGNASEPLLVRNGGLTLGPPDGVLVPGVLQSGREHAVPHDTLTASESKARFPRYSMQEDWIAVFEPGAGFVRSDASIDARLRLSRRHGAELLLDNPVTAWSATSDGVRVESALGSFEGGHLVLCAGAWTGTLLHDGETALQVERQVSHWFAPASGVALGPKEMPVSMWELDGGQIFYTTPDVGQGIKAGLHHGGTVTTAATVDRTVSREESQEAQRIMHRLVAGSADQIRGSAVCLYTNTPDGHFLIDRDPAHERVTIVSACSGHGFKFSPAIGEIAADMVDGVASRVDISPFSMSRFTVP